MPDLSEKLAALFEADRDAPDHAERFPSYGFVHSEIGCKPWHPPAERVWQSQGEDYDSTRRVAEVWEILQSLFSDYRSAVS